jgi:DNA segregation ATPase FtsK/SpoIIIE and related proteins
MARIVCVVDELGDLMMQDRRAFTRLIAEISGMARATGIHMVCATHRPSVDVLSGKVKVNFPGRMAFRVTSAVDSKVILHRKGAESLLGRGDMMYLSPTRSTTIRIHAPWVPLVDVKAIADKLREVEAARRAKEEKERIAAEEKRLAELRAVQGTMAAPTFGAPRTMRPGEQETMEISFGYLGTKK